MYYKGLIKYFVIVIVIVISAASSYLGVKLV